jgi:hypothetical protein
VFNYLNNTFWKTWIGRTEPKYSAPCSPDFTPLDFFTWSFVKSKVYKRKVPDLHDQWQCIHEAAKALTPNMRSDGFRAAMERWEQCLKLERGQVELY